MQILQISVSVLFVIYSLSFVGFLSAQQQINIVEASDPRATASATKVTEAAFKFYTSVSSSFVIYSMSFNFPLCNVLENSYLGLFDPLEGGNVSAGENIDRLERQNLGDPIPLPIGNFPIFRKLIG
jgi:hypothetical protein